MISGDVAVYFASPFFLVEVCWWSVIVEYYSFCLLTTSPSFPVHDLPFQFSFFKLLGVGTSKIRTYSHGHNLVYDNNTLGRPIVLGDVDNKYFMMTNKHLTMCSYTSLAPSLWLVECDGYILPYSSCVDSVFLLLGVGTSKIRTYSHGHNLVYDNNTLGRPIVLGDVDNKYFMMTNEHLTVCSYTSLTSFLVGC
ncbi:hypothetical protein BDA99DRAFT_535985 [Phascolomyces articulosus]|uniref:Uncharacterized protein n=1 Tax=Phascolomyces articulosus TaxID=60185 RepID=A0AAD5K2F5_9FUNG|nr:hypothetical protein BDA99DRAFT_535985 [Phascolomyces articulosus]